MSMQLPDLEPDFFTYETQGIFEVRVANGVELDNKTGPAFKATLCDAIANYACRALVIDVNGAAYANSETLVHLVAAQNAAQEKGIPVVIDTGTNKRVQQLLRMTGLVDVLQVITTYQQS